jgi:4-amino-4-deoxy-L-arabinose transferase-like glycosyltransferase
MKSQKPVRAVDAGFRKAFLLLLGITVFRLVFSTHHELVPDEAYYWEWSRHLDFCYRDKGPMVAWAIAFGTWIAGDTVFGIRWIGILLAMGTSWQLYRLARRLFDEPTAWRVLLVSCVVPLLAVGAIVMTIDSLCVFFWAWSMNLAWTAFEKDRKRDWLLLGLGIGLGFLSKFTNVLQLVSVLGYWAWTPLQRQRFRWANLACLLVPFAACAALILFWNILHDWPNARALESRSGVELGFHLHPQELIKYLQEQLLVTSPFIYVGIGVAAVGLLLGRIQENRIRF